jgi:hypothetical protein
MRTLGEILTTAESGELPTHDECYWALVAMAKLEAFDSSDTTRNLAVESPVARQMRAEESFKRRKRAYASDPKAWLGPEHDPTRPEVQERRQAALRLFEKVSKDLGL